MNTIEKISYIQKTLDKLYPTQPIPLKHKDNYTLLIAVLLSARCTDKRVNEVTPELFALADSPQEMIKHSPETIRKIIRPCGLSPQKSRAIYNLSHILLDKHKGQVPCTFEELEELPGVGHKTASVVMSQAFGHPAFAVDTHVHRLAERWGLSDGRSVVKTERDLKNVFEERHWNKLHLQLIYYGREYCTARGCPQNICMICETIRTRKTTKKSKQKTKKKMTATKKPTSKAVQRTQGSKPQMKKSALSAIQRKQQIRKFHAALKKASKKSTKKWFDNYLKGAIEYRGVTTPETRRLVLDWYRSQNLESYTVASQLQLVSDLIKHPYAEDKFAGAACIKTFLLKQATSEQILKLSESLLKAGHLNDWVTIDTYCLQVLGPLIKQHGKSVAQAVTRWKTASRLWHRRSSLVPFCSVAKDSSYDILVSRTIASLVKEDERFIQTAVGWVIASISRHRPKVASQLVEKHFDQLSMEAIRRHTKYLPKYKTYLRRAKLRD